VKSLYVVEIQGRGVITQPGRGVGGGGDIRFGHHFVGDPQKLSLLVESFQELAQVVVGHRISPLV
jgi:hypothetical protein